tara:strand:- start:1610 stop:2569 length:960 start_codon:yes stop_codon:yes gene_type:complete
MTEIPSVNRSLRYEEFNQVILKNYSLFTKEYTTFLSEWLTDTNKIFNDSEKFYILIYIFSKNLEFYNKNLIEFDYETFDRTNQFDVQKINIVEIAKSLNIAKETARRKILELQNEGVIIRKKKNIIIDKNSFELFDIKNTLNSLTNLLFIIYNVCLQDRIIKKNILKEDIFNILRKRFSFVMHHYFEFIIPWTTRWKKFFDNDVELFIIWGVIILNKTVKIIKKKDEKLTIENWRSELEKINSRGINTMSLAEITGIPRPTVSRKIKKLLKKNLAMIDEYKLIHPETSVKKSDLVKIQNISVASFSKFAFTVSNLLIFN